MSLEPFGLALAQFQGMYNQRQAEAAAVAAASQYFNSLNGGQGPGWPGAPLVQSTGYGPFGASFGTFTGSAPSFGRPWPGTGSQCLPDGLPSNLPSNTPSLDNGAGSGMPEMPSTSQQQMALNGAVQACNGPSVWPSAPGASNASALLAAPSWRSSGTKLQQPSTSGRTVNDGTTIAASQQHLHARQQPQQQFSYPALTASRTPANLLAKGPAALWPSLGAIQQAPNLPGMGVPHSSFPPATGDELVLRLLRGESSGPVQQQSEQHQPAATPSAAAGSLLQQQAQQQQALLLARQLSHAAAGPSGTAPAAATALPLSQHTPGSMRAQLGERNYYTIRALLVRQQETFMKQVWELHRLHRMQRYLSRELACTDHALTVQHEGQAAAHVPSAAPTLPIPAVKQQQEAAAVAAKLQVASPLKQQQHSLFKLAAPIQVAAAMPAAAAKGSSDKPLDALTTLSAHIHLLVCIPATMRKVFQAPEPASGSDDAAAALAEEAPRSPPVEPLDARDFWVAKDAAGIVRPVASRIQLNATGAMSGDTTVQAAPGSPALAATATQHAPKLMAVHAVGHGVAPLGGAAGIAGVGKQHVPAAAAVAPSMSIPTLSLPDAASMVLQQQVAQRQQQAALQPQLLLFQQQQQLLLLQQQAQANAAAAAPAAPAQAAAEQAWPLGEAAAAAASSAPVLPGPAALNLFRPTPQISPMFASRFLSGQQQPQQLPSPAAGSSAAAFDPHAFWFAKHCEARQQAQGAAASAGQAAKRCAAPPGLPPHPAPAPGAAIQPAAAPQLLPMQPPPAVSPSAAAKAGIGSAGAAGQRPNVLRWRHDAAAVFGELGLVDPDGKPAGGRHHSPSNGGEVTSALTGPSSRPSSVKRPSSHHQPQLKKRVKYGLDGVTRSPELPHPADDGDDAGAEGQQHKFRGRSKSRSTSPHHSPHKGGHSGGGKGADKRSAFKRVVPTKVRSKRGSNRACTESIGSDNSTSSIDKGGKGPKQEEPRSVVGGKGAVAPAPSVTATAANTSGMLSHAGGFQSTAKSAAGILLSMSSSFHAP